MARFTPPRPTGELRAEELRLISSVKPGDVSSDEVHVMSALKGLMGGAQFSEELHPSPPF